MMMNDDDNICLCFGVSKSKIVHFCRRENPPVASLISECLSAGTGCGWCVPYLEDLHTQIKAGADNPDITITAEEYVQKRRSYRKTGKRE